jgi:prevent-host-death family protein
MTDPIEQSSGNIFADLGLPNAGQELLKAELTLQVHRLLKQRGISQTNAAKLLGTTQPQVSALMGLKPVAVSVGRLMEFLTVLGQDVQVRVNRAMRRGICRCRLGRKRLAFLYPTLYTLLMRATSATNLRKNLDHEPLIITREGGKPSAVLMSLEDFASWQETDYLLKHPVDAKRLLDSIAELEAGNGVERELIE